MGIDELNGKGSKRIIQNDRNITQAMFQPATSRTERLRLRPLGRSRLDDKRCIKVFYTIMIYELNQHITIHISNPLCFDVLKQCF